MFVGAVVVQDPMQGEVARERTVEAPQELQKLLMSSRDGGDRGAPALRHHDVEVAAKAFGVGDRDTREPARLEDFQKRHATRLGPACLEQAAHQHVDVEDAKERGFHDGLQGPKRRATKRSVSARGGAGV